MGRRPIKGRDATFRIRSFLPGNAHFYGKRGGLTTKTNICLIDVHIWSYLRAWGGFMHIAPEIWFCIAHEIKKTSSAITVCRENKKKTVSRSYACESVPKTRCECFWGYPASGVPWLSFEVERRACFLLWCVSDGTQIVVDPFLVSFSSLFRLQEQVHQFCHRGSEGHYSDFVWRLVLRWTVWSNDKAMGRMVETASQSICSIELTLIWMRMTQWHCLDVTWPNYHDFVTSTQHLATWLYFQWSQLSTSGGQLSFCFLHCTRPCVPLCSSLECPLALHLAFFNFLSGRLGRLIHFDPWVNSIFHIIFNCMTCYH